MLRKEVVVVSDPGSRDDGKAYLIEERPALQAEKWAHRLLIATKGTSGQIDMDVVRLGIVGVSLSMINAILAAPMKYEDLEPLLDEMLTCVKVIRDPRHPDVATALTPDAVEEVKTLTWLRGEILRVHTNFPLAEAFWSLVSAVKTGSPDSQSTSTSPP